jgi:hypothetical protein
MTRRRVTTSEMEQIIAAALRGASAGEIKLELFPFMPINTIYSAIRRARLSGIGIAYKPRPPRKTETQGISIRIKHDEIAELELIAAKYRISIGALVEKLIYNIIEDNLFDAVLETAVPTNQRNLQ